MLLLIIKIIFSVFCNYTLLSAGCEYRNYRGGHKFIKAFPARTYYQRLFTAFQCEKDIDRRDLGKLTYLGYTGIVITTIAAIPGTFLVIYFCWKGDYPAAEQVILFWMIFGSQWGVLSLVIQGFDSLINRLF